MLFQISYASITSMDYYSLLLFSMLSCCCYCYTFCIPIRFEEKILLHWPKKAVNDWFVRRKWNGHWNNFCQSQCAKYERGGRNNSGESHKRNKMCLAHDINNLNMYIICLPLNTETNIAAEKHTKTDKKTHEKRKKTHLSNVQFTCWIS